jgi:hypothetical protein
MIGKMPLEDGREVSILHSRFHEEGGAPVAVEVFKTSGEAVRYAAQERRAGRSTATKKQDIAFNCLSFRVWVVLVREKGKAAA